MLNSVIPTKINLLLIIMVLVSALFDVTHLQNSTNGCCDQCDTWTTCKGHLNSENFPVKCTYAKFDKSKVRYSSIETSCGKPTSLSVQTDVFDDIFYLNISWMFPQDSTISQVTGFLLEISSESEGMRNDDIVNFFNVTGIEHSGLNKLLNVVFVYNCLRAFPYTNYTVKVRTLPSNETAFESRSLVTKMLPNYNVNCSSRWVAYMSAALTPPQVTVCFHSAPAIFGMSSYVLHVMTYLQYNGTDTEPSDYLKDISFAKLEEYGERFCTSFTLRKEGYYVAKLQPSAWCTCYGEREVCHHTYITFTMPTVTVTPTSVVTSPYKQTTVPPWHVAVIASIVSLIVITTVLAIGIYCFYNRLKDFFYKFMMTIAAIDTKVLVVFLPTFDVKTNEAIKNFVYRLKFKSRALIHTMPKLPKSNNIFLQTATICVKSKNFNDISTPSKSISCKCKFCGLDVSDNTGYVVHNKLKEELHDYNQLIILHSEQSSKILDIYSKTADVPVTICRAFTQMVNMYGHTFDEDSTSNISMINDRTYMNEDHAAEVVPPQKEFPDEKPINRDSGYCFNTSPDSISLTNDPNKSFMIELQNKKDENNQPDKEITSTESTENLNGINISIPESIPQADDKICSNDSKSTDLNISLCCTCLSPVIMHAVLNKAVDKVLISRVFNNPPIYNVDTDFSEIAKSITNPQTVIFISPSPTSEI